MSCRVVGDCIAALWSWWWWWWCAVVEPLCRGLVVLRCHFANMLLATVTPFAILYWVSKLRGDTSWGIVLEHDTRLTSGEGSANGPLPSDTRTSYDANFDKKISTPFASTPILWRCRYSRLRVCKRVL